MANTAGTKKPTPGVARLPSKPCESLESCSTAASSLLFELSPVELIELVAKAIQEVVDTNKYILGGHRQPASCITRFHNREPPAISLEGYLKRLLHLSPFSLDTLLVAVVYLYRLSQRQSMQSVKDPTLAGFAFQYLFGTVKTPAKLASTRDNPASDLEADEAVVRSIPPLTPWTCHRLLLAALAVAAKYTSDAYIGQARLAKVAGIAISELYELEAEFFDSLEYRCYITIEELQNVCEQLLVRSRGTTYRQQGDHAKQADAHANANASGCASSTPASLAENLARQLSLGSDRGVARTRMATPSSNGSSESSYLSSSADSKYKDSAMEQTDIVKMQMPALIPIP